MGTLSLFSTASWHGNQAYNLIATRDLAQVKASHPQQLSKISPFCQQTVPFWQDCTNLWIIRSFLVLINNSWCKQLFNIISNYLKKLDLRKDTEKKEITILAIYKERRRNYCYMTKSRFLLCRNLQFLGDNVSHYPTQDKMKLTNTYWLPTNSVYSLEQEFQHRLLFWCQINKIRLQGIKWIMGEVLPKKGKMEEKNAPKKIFPLLTPKQLEKEFTFES